MELAHIKEFLERYKKLIFRDEEKRKKIIEVISKISGVCVSEKELNIKNNTLSITGGSTTKNELFLYQEKIIDELRRNHINDIVEIR
ncbi:MAG: hypothetical protein A3D65_05480 [Candidatus Lloydbacteria bacterium RIFCSPHIGHO2_02_FULL_50_13]|uniref:Uncharacterized protein n=1 Tax=Candidatus Lloydbacteria bacterium RIFCSPHIGHO2_02_FULL_50_13 TaxID=1798661 RepID=A0A1G2DAG4_9BACT|nr:MAG: hypothetical protein A3D65_05480 [Candidatus Lloydbacteria bacterium RIFCSPHIGHO2_02_FULL_50_13]